MQTNAKRDLGAQPVARLMAEHSLRTHDLVAASTEQITHKMVKRACKGRRLTRNVQRKIVVAMNRACEQHYTRRDLFTY